MKNKIIVLALLLTTHQSSRAMEKSNVPSSMEEIEKQYKEALRSIETNQDLNKTETFLLSIKDRYPEAYTSLAFIATKQDALIHTRESAQKLLLYTQDAVNHGFPELIGEVGFAYERLGRYEEARACYQKAALTYNQSQSYINLARLLLRGVGGNEDTQLAVRYLQIAYNAGNQDAIYDLATAYASGRGASPNPELASKYYSEIIKDPSNENYAFACNDVGLLYEWGHLKPPKNKTGIEVAVEYFTKAIDAPTTSNNIGVIRGKVHIARLIWTGKIGDSDTEKKEQAKKDLAEYSKQGDDLALYFYTAILINEGNIDQALSLLSYAYEQDTNPLSSLTKLQLAIAYQDGWIDAANSASQAKALFEAILSNPDKYFRSTFLARAYMYIMGLGVEKNEDLGFRLLEESKNKTDDIFLDTYALLPDLKIAEEAFHEKKEALRKKLIEEEEKNQKTKKLKPKGKATASSGGPSIPKEESRESREEEIQVAPKTVPEITASSTPKSILDLPINEWNNYWKTSDNSVILSVNRSRSRKTTIIISDPSRDEELVVSVDQKPYLHFTAVRELNYDARIKKRQEDDQATGEIGHIFAQMLDYVIQCAGKRSLFAKDGSDEPKDQIIGMVTRIDKKTKKETRCRAEYTFYKDKKGKEYLYHRYLKPIRA